jgi:hypothetical protein
MQAGWSIFIARKGFFMTEFPKYYGLCETCDHDATCTLRRSSQLKIIMCEEFETQAGINKPAPSDSGKRASELDNADGLGLCAHCLNGITCAFPDARHNVLYCEEYSLDEAGVVPPIQCEYSRSAA